MYGCVNEWKCLLDCNKSSHIEINQLHVDEYFTLSDMIRHLHRLPGPQASNAFFFYFYIAFTDHFSLCPCLYYVCTVQ